MRSDRRLNVKIRQHPKRSSRAFRMCLVYAMLYKANLRNQMGENRWFGQFGLSL